MLCECIGLRCEGGGGGRSQPVWNSNESSNLEFRVRRFGTTAATIHIQLARLFARDAALIVVVMIAALVFSFLRNFVSLAALCGIDCWKA